MFKKNARVSSRDVAADPKTLDRKSFDALMVSIRARRVKRCAERVIPLTPIVEAA